MRRIEINDANPGMVLGKTIYTSSGNILLRAGMRISPKYIHRLKELGIPAIYVKDEVFFDVDIPEVISEETRQQAQRAVRDIFADVQRCRRVDISTAKDVVNGFVDELLANPKVIVNLTDVRSYDDYTFGHSVNVCVLSLLTGISLGYNEIQLRNLGVGALLHDLGKTQVDKKILQKPGPLSEAEFTAMKEHTCYGFEILRSEQELSLLSAHVALQHHERVDGSGYPRAMCGGEIHEYARITAVADVYDAMTSDRQYRKALHTSEVVQKIISYIGKQFDPEITRAFLGNIAVYPIGSIVTLSTREVAIVVDNHKNNPMNPVVRVILDEYGNRIPAEREIDLAKGGSVRITTLLNQESKNLPSIADIQSRL